jgi:hypothetical protein
MFLLSLLFLILGLGDSSFAQHITTSQKHTSNQASGTAFPKLPQPRNEYVLEYGASPQEMLKVQFRGGRTSVLFPKRLNTPEFRKQLEIEIRDAYLCIEPLGCTHAPLTICIVDRIRPNFRTKQSNLDVFGLTFERMGTTHIAVIQTGLRFDNLAHELCHLRLAELGSNYSWWLEEGLSECFESWTYVACDHLDALRKNHSATKQELIDYKPLQGNEEGVRATAWAIAYYLLVIKKTPWDELERRAASIDPQFAIAAVLKALP